MTYSGVLRFFQIKGAEVPTFLNMLGHSFFNALAIAFSFTAINVLLVEMNGIENLPYIYLLGGFLMLITGRIYSSLESSLPPQRLFTLVLLFCMGWAIVARSADLVQNTLLFVSFLYALYLVIYQLSNLEFWGVASLLYDVRQSKRLFGMLTTGESVAKILGYMATPLIVTWFSVYDLFLCAAVAFLISLFFFYRLARLNKEGLKVAHHHDEDHEKKSGSWLSVFRISDPFLRITGLFALLAVLVYYFVHYTFLNRVEVHFREAEELAYFFGLFFSFGTFLNLANRLLVFNRLFKMLRIGNMILILPAFLAAFTLAGLVGMVFIEDPLYYMLWVFGLIMLFDEILRSSLHLPSFFVLFQPLSKHKRLEGHTLAKGRMEPLGMLMAGGVMLALIWFGVFTIQSIIVCLAVAVILWILIGVKVSGMYGELVRFMLKNRLLTSRNLDFSKEELGAIGGEVSASTDPVNLLYRLKVMGPSLPDQERKDMLVRLLSDENPLILKEALALAGEFRDERMVPYARELAAHENLEVSSKAVFLLCSFLEDDAVEELEEDIRQSTGERKEQLVAAVLKYSGIVGATTYGSALMGKARSGTIEDRITAARVIGLVGLRDYYHPLAKLLRDSDREVRRAAIAATATVKNEKLIPILFEIVISGDLFREASRAIASFGKEAIPHLVMELKKSYDNRIHQRLLKIAGHIHLPGSLRMLVSELLATDPGTRSVAISGIYYSGESISGAEVRDKVDHLLDLESRYFDVLVAQLLYSLAEDDDRLRRSLLSELDLQRDRVLKIAGLWYGRKLIQRVSDNLRSADRNLAVNAIELLENRLVRRDAARVIPVVEFSLETLYDWKKSHHNYKKDQGIEALFPNGCVCASEWLIALMVRIYRERDIELPRDIIPRLEEIESEAVMAELNAKN